MTEPEIDNTVHRIDGKDQGDELTFSVCTLVTDPRQYATVLESFRERGFSDQNSEFLIIDNSVSNKFDGYSGIRAFLRCARGKYVVVCHQDVELVDDGYAELYARLEVLEELDPDWAIAGNSGLTGIGRWALRISDPVFENERIGKLPAEVRSLDENLLIIKRASLLAPSHDLEGFHFYGLDLCLQAHLQGNRAYVIDFHLHHHSSGTKSSSYYDGLQRLEKKYAKLVSGQLIQTTCDLVFLGSYYRFRFLRRVLKKLFRETTGYDALQTQQTRSV